MTTQEPPYDPSPAVLHVDDDPALPEASEPLLTAAFDCAVLTATSASEGGRRVARTGVGTTSGD